ncbi:MAG: serine/threonine protein kinase [Deltaproteobacteria bacterium]|nr:serine/threonine protein kinase [Deltaproteobacteria bacterium]
MSEAAHEDPLIGTVIADRYRVDEKVGDGGMGAVYRVEHTHMRKRLALKVLHHDLCSYPEIVARFEREAMAAANIEHPNVANATDFGKLADGTFYLVLEYVEGLDLRQLLQRDRYLVPARAVHIALQVLGALGRAHELEIVHRDLKPENILLVEKDGDPEFVKVLDFGIARVPVGALGAPRTSGDKPLTKAGTVYGTPEYMAPEQALGQQVDGRADLYALGVLLFEMLTGVRPYDDVDKVALLGAHVSKPIPRVSSRAPRDQYIPEGLELVITQALAKQPDDRFQSAGDFAGALLDLGFEAPLPIIRHPSRNADKSGAFSLGADSRPSAKIRIDDRVPAETAPTTPQESLDSSRQAPALRPSPSPAPESPLPPAVAEPTRGSRVPWVIAALSVLAAVAAVLVLRRPDQVAPATPIPSATATAATATDTATTDATSSAPPSSPSANAKELALRALGRVASGEIEGGVKDLEALVVKYPTEPAVLRAMAQSYAKGKRPGDALGAIKKLVAVSPESASDPLLTPIFEDALADPKAADDAVATLVGPLGKPGAKLLYETAFSEKAPAAARARATKAVRDPKVAKNLPASIRALVDLRLATACPAKKTALDKNKKALDADALPLLQSMAKPTCGFDHKQPCWPCIKDLDVIIKDVEARK